jgi:ribosome maturation factor RimP
VRPLRFLSLSGDRLEAREEVRQLAQPLADEAGFELVDVELAVQGRQRVVRVLLDKPGGMTVGNCASFSRSLADRLDMNQTVAGSYRLEVSSPGMDRPLRGLAAVARFAGSQVALVCTLPRDGRRHFDGTLLEPVGGTCGVRTEDGMEHWFDWSEVKSVRLAVDPWEQVRAARAKGAAAGGSAVRRERGGSR